MKLNWICFFLLLTASYVLHGSEKQDLIETLAHPRFWSAVHAAEYLIELETAPQAVEKFIQAHKSNEKVPVKRIGVWRVKALYARSRGDSAEYSRIIGRLKDIAFAPEQLPDKIHSLETLFKLNVKCTPAEQDLLKKYCKKNPAVPGLKIYSAALLARNDHTGLSLLANYLKQYRSDNIYCGVLLYVCGQYDKLPEDVLAVIGEIYRGSSVNDHKISAAGILLKHQKISPEAVKTLPEKLCISYLKVLDKFSPDRTACSKVLEQMLKSDNIELKIFAAYTFLKHSAQ